MKRSHWTFLYVPEGEGGVRTVHVRKRLVMTLCGALTVLALVVAALVTGFVRQGIVLHDADEREREIRALQSKITDLEGKVGAYEQAMAANFELLEKANLMAGLEPLDETVIQMGVGGAEPRRDDVLESIAPLDRQRMLEIQDQMDQLLRQARFQRESYDQVLSVLQSGQELRDSTPSIRPLSRGYLSSRYGRRIDPFTGTPAMHSGIDFSAPIGTPVFATAGGTVVRAGRRGSMGKMVELEHGNGIITRFGHLNGFNVAKGETVSRGDVIGYVGNTGRSTAPHVHYEVVKNGRTENPWLYIVRD